MTEQDELSRLARAITEAEDELNTSNHRDDTQQLAQIDEQRTALVERIEAREKALEDAREAMTAYAEKLRPASVRADTASASDATYSGIDGSIMDGIQCAEFAPRSVPITTVVDPVYSNGLDGHQED